MPPNRPWAAYYTILLLTLLVLAIVAANRFDSFVFNDVTTASIVTLLAPLFVIAAFLERAQEVFISTWREMGEVELEQALKRARELTGGPTLSQREGYDPVASAAAALGDYKARTRRIAFLSGLAGGVLISVAGVRVLRPLVSWDAELGGAQDRIFDVVDIVLTGGLLGGGADGIHKPMSLVLDFLDKTRARVNRSQAGGVDPGGGA